MSINLDFNSYFKNRSEAIMELLEVLPHQRMQDEDWLIVACSEQALVLANKVALKLNLTYDILFTGDVVTPNNDSCVIAVVSETEEIVIQEQLVKAFGINLDYIYSQAHRVFDEKILPKVYKYKKGELINSIKGRNILFMDVGCETGFRMMSCIKTAIKLRATSIMCAVPIMATDVFETLQKISDEIFCAKKVDNFVNVDFYYKDMQKLSQNDIIEVLNNSKGYLPFSKNRSDNGI
jgi:putative phosphoribosyl transferase